MNEARGTDDGAPPGGTPFFDRVYLASRSPRRRELLARIGVCFDALMFRGGARADPEIDETPRPGEAAEDYVRRLAIGKAEHGGRLLVWRKCAARPLICADTALELDGDIIGKPADRDDAFAILRRLSGRGHRVLTGVAVSFGQEMKTCVSISVVHFRALDDAEIHRYVASGEPLDKAGAYAIQGGADLFVEHASGSFTGIMGLPLCETGLLLKAAGYRFI